MFLKDSPDILYPTLVDTLWPFPNIAMYLK